MNVALNTAGTAKALVSGSFTASRVPVVLVLLIAALLSACAAPPNRSDLPTTSAYTDTAQTRLGRFASSETPRHAGQSGIRLLADGLDAFVARAALAQAAERSIDAQYYLWHGDITGTLLAYQLLAAADRGVRVRLLLDDMGLQGRDLALMAMDRHPNIEVRIVNPFARDRARALQFVGRLGSVTRRMHNKSFTVDNQITILGGRNIGDEYFEADPSVSFGDLDVLAIGPAVGEASGAFDLYWNSAISYPVSDLLEAPPLNADIARLRHELEQFVDNQRDSEYLEALRGSALADELRTDRVAFVWGEAKVVFDHPDKLIEARHRTDLHLSSQLGSLLDNLRQELIVISPYFVPGKAGVKALIALSKKGVRVRILTNSLAATDVPVVHAGYARYRKALLEGGVELFELNKSLTRAQIDERQLLTGSSAASLHAKTYVFDREQVFIGSMNLDPRSVVENTEIGLVVRAQQVARPMAEWFDQNIDRLAFRLETRLDRDGVGKIVWSILVDGERQVFDVEPYTSFWQRFMVRLIGLLPIESQL